MAAENYWRYAEAWQKQQAMAGMAPASTVARQHQQHAMAGMAPASTVARQHQQHAMAGMAPAATVAQAAAAAAVVGMQQQQVAAMAMAQQQQQQQLQAAAPSLKRARPDYGDVRGGQDITGYYPRENAGYHSLRDNEAIGASYDRYLRNGMPSVGANEASRAVVGGMGGAVMGGSGMNGYTLDDRRMMGVAGMDSRGMRYDERHEAQLPADATNTVYIEGLPANCTRREASHIFRPFVGFREVRLVNKEPRFPGGVTHVLCFVDFDSPEQAAVALQALQGYKFDEHDRESTNLRLQFSRFPGPRSGGGPRGRR